jgi:hypothetical protein
LTRMSRSLRRTRSLAMLEDGNGARNFVIPQSLRCRLPDP